MLVLSRLYYSFGPDGCCVDVLGSGRQQRFVVVYKTVKLKKILRRPSEDRVFLSLFRVTGACSTSLSALQVSALGALGRCLEHRIWSLRGSASVWGLGCLSLGVPVEVCWRGFEAPDGRCSLLMQVSGDAAQRL